jgi:orotate phosphoribosyltransferase
MTTNPTPAAQTEFSAQPLIDLMISHGAIGFYQDPITLKSGKKSYWYVNWRSLLSDVALIDQVTDILMAFSVHLQLRAATFYGVPEGCTKLGLIMQYKWAMRAGRPSVGSAVLPMGRGKPKDHGLPEDRFFVGKPGGRLVVLEDVTTTGGSLIAVLAQLREMGVFVESAITLTDRGSQRPDGLTVRQAVESMGINYFPLVSATDVLPHAARALKPAPHIVEALINDFPENLTFAEQLQAAAASKSS